MSSCKHVEPLLVLFAEEALDLNERQMVESHLRDCRACREEAAGITRIRGWLADPELFAPQEDLVWQLLPEKLAARAPVLPLEPRRRFPVRMPRWALGFAAVVALACGLFWIGRDRTASPLPTNLASAGAGNEAFLERMRTAYAREATSQYLKACQDLLLDVMKPDKTCGGDRFDVAFEVARARELLRQKQQLETNLSVPDVAHARELCDQIEHVLLNLSMSSECEPGDTLRDMESFIESEQLLLRINLVQSGI